MTSNAERQRAFWIAWLQVVLLLLAVYALVLVFGAPVAERLFSAFGFGPPDSIASVELSTYLTLPFAVLGSVMVGWAVLMFILVRGPLTSGAQWVIPALAVPIGLWFLLDTGMSLVLGYLTHALFNVPFALALGVPLWRLRASARR
jgi:hypothetical protein